MIFVFFFFNDTATTEIYTLSLHDALPICFPGAFRAEQVDEVLHRAELELPDVERSEEHTSELQSLTNIVCRLLLEKKNYMMISESAEDIDNCYNVMICVHITFCSNVHHST